MADYFSTLLFWHWWLLGLVLVVAAPLTLAQQRGASR